MEGSSTHLRCSVRIDLCALERNLGKLRSFLPDTKAFMGLVSADAFGCGVEAAVVRLMLSGADAFAVTNSDEGKCVREVGEGWPVIVMSSTLPGEERIYFEQKLTPVLVSEEEIARFEECAMNMNRNLPVHMRLPVKGTAIPSPEEAKAMLVRLEKSERLRLEAFCLPGTGTGAPTEGTIPDAGFLEFAASRVGNLNLKPYIHHSDVVNLAGLPPEFGRCLRIGLVLFGAKPSQNSILKGFEPEQVLTFRSSVSQIKTLPKGATVGYSRKYTMPKESKVALISAGYGDGLARGAGGKAHVLIRGKRAPIIGIVSMDQASIDVGNFDEIEVGDEAIIIGESEGEKISVEDYCNALSITPAQALTSITKRVARFYKTLY